MSPPSSERLSQLTARQRDVLSLLAEGRSNKEIADELGITAGTVKLHMTRIFRALNVSNRTQAVIAATEMMRPAPNQTG